MTQYSNSLDNQKPDSPGSTTTGDDSFHSIHDERRPLTVNNNTNTYRHQFYGDASETDYSDAWEDLNQSHNSNPFRLVSPKRPLGKHAEMDNSNKSVGSIQSLRDKLSQLRSLSHQHIHTSIRRVQQVVAEHTGSIGMLGSLSIAINNLTGPAMLSLPATFVRAGIIPTTLTLLFVCVLSSLCALQMANTISKVPGNHDFQQGVEFPEAFRTYWGHGWFIAANWLFFACITCLNVSSLVDNAQVLDTFLGHINPYGGAWAFSIDPVSRTFNWTNWEPSVCSEKVLYEGGCIPFASSKEEDEDAYFLTIGYLVTAVLFFPLALMDLTENVQWQILGFFILIVTSIQFIVTFAMSDLESSHLTWWGESYESLLGVILFNFALVITVPAWLYEKEPHVDIPTTMHASAITSTVLYLAIGILGCMAMPDVSDNFLESIMSGVLGPAMQIGASIFAFFIIGLNIPLFSILTRLSLMGGGNEHRSDHEDYQFCSRNVANILSVYLPFGLSWTMYQGSKVTTLLSWGGMIFTSLVSFLLPLALALSVVSNHFEESKGFVRTYPWCLNDLLSSKESQISALRILLILSSFAVAVAIVGNLIGDPEKA